MKTTLEIIVYLSLFITLFMAGLSLFYYRRSHYKEFSHTLELWIALALNMLLCHYFRNNNPEVRALTMLGWIWPIRAFQFILEDLSICKIQAKWEYIGLGAAGFLSLVLSYFGQPFMIYTIPFVVASVAVGSSFLIQSYKKIAHPLRSPLYYSMFFLVSVFFAMRIPFPYSQSSLLLSEYGVLGDFLVVTGFTACTLAVYMELFRKRQETKMAGMLQERTDKLFSQSKYSELGMMSAGIAHEINNPLAVIQARTTQLLRIYRDTGKQKDLGDGLEQILYTSERINRTIQGVREFVHQDDKASEDDVELQDLVDDVLAFCGQRMKNHGISLRFYNLENFSVYGHKIQLEQVLLNLLNNAFDAIEFLSDKWIEVSAHSNNDRIQIFVKDSGHGIPPEIAAKIMEPFFSTKDLSKGTGLGLALARGIVEKHGGTLEYVADGNHTTFMFELPRFRDPMRTSNWNEPIIHQ